MLIGIHFTTAEAQALHARLQKDSDFSRIRKAIQVLLSGPHPLAACKPGPPPPAPMKPDQIDGLTGTATVLAVYHMLDPTPGVERTLRDFLLWTREQEVLLHYGAFLEGHFLKAIILALDAVGETLTPDQRRAVLEHLILTTVEDPDPTAFVNNHPAGHVPLRRTLDYPGSGFHVRDEDINNWDILGAMGVLYVARAADALLPHRAADVAAWTAVAQCRVEKFFRLQYTDEGEYGEGPGYYSYATAGAILVLELLKHWPRGAWWPELKLTGLMASARWARECSPREVVHGAFNFNDCGLGGREYPFVIGWVAAQTRDPAAQAFGDELLALTAAGLKEESPARFDLENFLWSLLWRDPTLTGMPSRDPATHNFGRFGTVISRTGYTSDDLCFCFRCGALAGAHTHADRGNFLLTAYGENIVAEAGKPLDRSIPEYNRFHRQSAAHNIAMPTGQPQVWYDGARGCNGHITEFATLPDGLFLRADITEVYPGVGRVERSVRFSQRGWLVIQDFIEKPGAGIDFLLHTDNRDRQADLSITPNHAVIRRPKASLLVFPLWGGQFKDAGTNYQDSDPHGLRSLVLHRAADRLATLLVVVRAGEEDSVQVAGAGPRQWELTIRGQSELINLQQ